MSTELNKKFDWAIDHILNTRPLGSVYGNREEIRRFLKDHERKPVVIKSIFDQITKAESSTVEINSGKYDKLILTVVSMFMDAAIDFRNQEIQSSLEKLRLKEKARRETELDQVLKEEGFEIHEVDQTKEEELSSKDWSDCA